MGKAPIIKGRDSDYGSAQDHEPSQSSIYTPEFWLIFVATCVLNLAANIFLLFPLFIVKLGGGATTIGAIIGVGSAAALVVRPWVSPAIHRYGRRTVALWMLVADVLIITLYIPISQIAWTIYAVRIVHGAVEGTARVAIFALVYEILPAGRQGEAMATFSLSGMGPASVGALLGELVMNRFGFGPFFGAAAALTGLSAMGVALFPRDVRTLPAEAKNQPAQQHGPGYRELLTGSPLMMLWIVALLFGLVNAVRNTFVAPFAYQVGIHSVGVYFTIYAAVAVILRLGCARLLDRFGMERLLIPAFLMLAVGIAMIAGSAYTAVLDIAAVLGGIGHAFAYPATSALVIRHTPTEATARSSTIYTSLWDVSAMSGPYLFGLVAHGLGYSPMFLMAAGLSLLAAIYMALDRRAVRSVASAREPETA